MGMIRCPDTPVTNYQPMLHNIPEERDFIYTTEEATVIGRVLTGLSWLRTELDGNEPAVFIKVRVYKVTYGYQIVQRQLVI